MISQINLTIAQSQCLWTRPNKSQKLQKPNKMANKLLSRHKMLTLISLKLLVMNRREIKKKKLIKKRTRTIKKSAYWTSCNLKSSVKKNWKKLKMEKVTFLMKKFMVISEGPTLVSQISTWWKKIMKNQLNTTKRSLTNNKNVKDFNTADLFRRSIFWKLQTFSIKLAKQMNWRLYNNTSKLLTSFSATSVLIWIMILQNSPFPTLKSPPFLACTTWLTLVMMIRSRMSNKSLEWFWTKSKTPSINMIPEHNTMLRKRKSNQKITRRMSLNPCQRRPKWSTLANLETGKRKTRSKTVSMSNPKPSKPFQRKFNNSISVKVDLKPSPKVKIHPDRHRFEYLKYLKLSIQLSFHVLPSFFSLLIGIILKFYNFVQVICCWLFSNIFLNEIT